MLTGNVSTSSDCRPVAHLESIPVCANRVELATYHVEAFINRFYSGSEATRGENAESKQPVGHKGQLERLCKALDRLEGVVLSLSDIG